MEKKEIMPQIISPPLVLVKKNEVYNVSSVNICGESQISLQLTFPANSTVWSSQTSCTWGSPFWRSGIAACTAARRGRIPWVTSPTFWTSSWADGSPSTSHLCRCFLPSSCNSPRCGRCPFQRSVLRKVWGGSWPTPPVPSGSPHPWCIWAWRSLPRSQLLFSCEEFKVSRLFLVSFKCTFTKANTNIWVREQIFLEEKCKNVAIGVVQLSTSVSSHVLTNYLSTAQRKCRNLFSSVSRSNFYKNSCFKKLRRHFHAKWLSVVLSSRKYGYTQLLIKLLTTFT